MESLQIDIELAAVLFDAKVQRTQPEETHNLQHPQLPEKGGDHFDIG
jgi:hypothetical protein